jgi:hypothetical protein
MYLLHGGSSCLEWTDFALATVATRPDEAGEPPLQVLRHAGHPPGPIVGGSDVGGPGAGSEGDGVVVGGAGAIIIVLEVLVTLPSVSALWSVTS